MSNSGNSWQSESVLMWLNITYMLPPLIKNFLFILFIYIILFFSFHLSLSRTSFQADGPWLFTKFTKPWHIAAVSDQVSSSMRIIFHVQDIRFLVNFSCEPPPVSVHPSSPDLQHGALTAARGTGRVTNVVSAATSLHQRPLISVQYYPTLASTDFYHCSQL